MKLSRLAGLAALGVLAIGQARAEPDAPADGLGFGIIRDLGPVPKPVVLVARPSGDRDREEPIRIERIRIVRSDAMDKD